MEAVSQYYHYRLIVCMALATGWRSRYRINITTATTGGVYYPLGNAFSKWTKNLPVRASAQATAGTHSLSG